MLQKVYPEWSTAEIDRLVAESGRDLMYEPFVEFREKPFAGRYVTVDARGFRPFKGQGPWPPTADHYNVFVFGGSTTFSYGLPDDDAVPAKLQERLAREPLPKPVRVYNLGHGFYYSSQERAYFQKLLVGGLRPDAAVFIDGLNDFLFYDDRPAMTPWLIDVVQKSAWGAGDPYQEAFKALPLTRLVSGWLPAGPAHPLPPRAKEPSPDDPAVATAVIERYLGNRAIIEAVAAAHGIRPIFVWQPVPTYRYTPPPGTPKQNYARHEYSRRGYPRMAAIAAEGRLPPTFVWCADIAEGNTGEVLYVDLVHYSPRMAAMLADCIVRTSIERGLLPTRAGS
jgi:hypothetical protein